MSTQPPSTPRASYKPDEPSSPTPGTPNPTQTTDNDIINNTMNALNITQDGLPSTHSNVGPGLSNTSSSKLRANSSFFASLLKSGHVVEVYNPKSKDFKSYLFQFSPEASALVAPTSIGSTTYNNYISLRKFAVSYNQNSPLQIILKTPNKSFTLRFRDVQLRTLFVNWLNQIQSDSSILAQNALLLSTSVVSKDGKEKPKWFVPDYAAEFCACCHDTFSSLGKKLSCHDCGYRFCSKTQCFTTQSNRCNMCLQNNGVVTYEGKSTGKEAPVPVFDEGQSLTSKHYFSDLNTEDPLIQQQQAQQRKLSELGNFGTLSSKNPYLSTTASTSFTSNDNKIVINENDGDKHTPITTPSNGNNNNNKNNNKITQQEEAFLAKEQKRVELIKNNTNVYGDYLLAVFFILLIVLPFLPLY